MSANLITDELIRREVLRLLNRLYRADTVHAHVARLLGKVFLEIDGNRTSFSIAPSALGLSLDDFTAQYIAPHLNRQRSITRDRNNAIDQRLADDAADDDEHYTRV